MKENQEILSLLKQLADNTTKNTQHELEHEALRVMIEEHKMEKELRLEAKRTLVRGGIRALIAAITVAVGYKFLP